MRNAFGQEVPPIYVLLKNERVARYVHDALAGVLTNLNRSKSDSSALAEQILGEACKKQRLAGYERRCHEILAREGIAEEIPRKLRGRSAIIAAQVRRHVRGHAVCDVGCGDGKVGEILASDREVVLLDVYRHPNVSSLEQQGMAFKLITAEGAFPLQRGSQDTALLLTVMHHAARPLHTLRQSAAMLKPGGRIIAIESVYGIAPNAKHPKTKENKRFAALSVEEQRLSNVFFDHFYNRVLHFNENPAMKVSVPFNFQTPRNWRRSAEKFGLKEIYCKNLGIDQLVVPEYHSLHVWQKK